MFVMFMVVEEAEVPVMLTHTKKIVVTNGYLWQGNSRKV